MSVEVITLGCRLNAYESEVIRREARAAQTAQTAPAHPASVPPAAVAEKGDGETSLIVINTCAVTAEAERQARQAIRRARRAHPQARVVVTGCAAQIAPQAYAQMPEVDQVLGNEEKLRRQSYLPGSLHSEPVQVNDIMSVRETAGHMITSFEGKARAFVQVQNGCDHRCTFCIIPYGRGNSRSVAMGEVVQQVRLLVEQGFQEVVLTGVDLTAYGQDLPGQPTLGQMIRRLLALVPDLPRLRLSSLDAVEVDDDLWQLLTHEPRMMPHVHLSLQAGDDMVLKRMKRRHLRNDIVRFCTRLKEARPEIVFGADIIAGFPTETDAMFANTLRLVDELELVYLHVFPYSARNGTPAARMPQVPVPVRKQRAQALRDAGQRQLQAFLARQIGQVKDVLVERPSQGRSAEFTPVQWAANVQGDTQKPPASAQENTGRSAQVGQIIPVRITGHTSTGWTGVPL